MDATSPIRTSGSLNARAPAPIRLFLDLIDRLVRLDGWIGGGCLLALTLLMLCEIGTRFLSTFLPFLPSSISVAWEYSSYLMAATFTFGAAMTLRAGGHIRVTLLLNNVPRPFARMLEVLTAFVGCIFMGFVAWAMVRFTWTAFLRDQSSVTSGTPIWFPEAVVTFGMLLLALQFLARFVQALLDLPIEDHRMRASPVE